MSSGDQKEKDTTSEIVNRTKSEADHQNEGIYKMCTYIWLCQSINVSVYIYIVMTVKVSIAFDRMATGLLKQLDWSKISSLLDKHLFFRSSDRKQNKTTFQQSFTKYWKEQQLGK